MERGDFAFVSELVDDFFRRVTIKRALKIIESHTISGWEKWLQVEFAAFIQGRPDVAEWCREFRYGLDRRVSKSRSTCSVDFSIRQKNKQSWIAVEMKQIKSPASCIKYMVKDVGKISKIKTSEDDIRSVWCIGVHLVEEPDEAQRLSLYYADQDGISLNKKHFVSKQIGRTGYSFTLF